MRLLKVILLLASRPSIWSWEILAANGSLIARQTKNQAHKKDEINSPQDPKSPATGLGSDPVNTGHDMAHYHHFFQASPQNIEDSQFGAAYADWIIGVDKTSSEWEDRLSEPDYFAKTVLEWPDDVNCGIAYNGCDGKPSCNEISRRIDNQTRARQICFIFDSFHHVSLISAQIHACFLAPFDVSVKLIIGEGTK